MKIVISSGHGLKVRGASGILDEVDEARRVVEQVADYLRQMGVDTVTFHDDTSMSQNENLNTIVNFHNSQGDHDLDVSVHFNAYAETSSPMGTECLYVTQAAMADLIAEQIANVSGLIDRGPKKRTDLFFLNQTDEASVLIEVCFVDSAVDAEIYVENFDEICKAIATTISGKTLVDQPERPEMALAKFRGKVSYFGGPDDMGVDADEGLAFIYDYEEAPWLFLDYQPANTTGLARRLNPDRPYVACRWDYSRTSKEMLAEPRPAMVRSPKTGKSFLAFPADWGPHEDTGRVADISPSLMSRLGIETDDEVEVTYPAPMPRKGG
jgi:N-acetylmuramoyl-L-alanine amidase